MRRLGVIICNVLTAIFGLLFLRKKAEEEVQQVWAFGCGEKELGVG